MTRKRPFASSRNWLIGETITSEGAIIAANRENLDSMTRFHISLFILAVCCLSCSPRQDVHAGFRDEPQGSVVFDFEEYALPASEIRLYDVVKAGGMYYCKFAESRSSGKLDFGQNVLMAFSATDRKPRWLTLPEDVRHIRSIFQQGDTLFLQIQNWDPMFECPQYYYFDPKDWKWNPYDATMSFGDHVYEDPEWGARYTHDGELGDAIWFVDKHSSKEYAFWGLGGKVHRIDGSFYVVERTRVYEIADPSAGFLCDSTTTYEKVKERNLEPRLPYLGTFYSSRGQSFMPIVQYDDCDPSDLIREGMWSDASIEFLSLYGQEFKADTLITGSFLSGGRLHCLLETPSATVLARWEDGRMVPVHDFPKFDQESRFSGFIGHAYPDPNRPGDETMLILAKRGRGSYDLYEMGEDGNTLLRLSYKHGLEAVGQDSFETLLDFLLDNWGKFSLDEVVRVEESLGAKVSCKGWHPKYSNIPGQASLSPEETFHVDVLTKQIRAEYYMDADYWIAESDSSIPVVELSWRDAYLGGPNFDRDAKADEIEAAITRRYGPGEFIPETDHLFYDFTEWHAGAQTIRLHKLYDLFLVIY